MPMVDKAEINQIAQQETTAMKSLVDFRRFFMPEKSDVQPAPFHFKWSEILLNGSGNYAFEAFRESAKTQIVIRANLLHALTYPDTRRSYLIVMCANHTLAAKRLRDVTREFQENKDMSALLEKIIEDNGDAFEATYTTGHKIRIEAYGKGGSVRGVTWGAKRPDLVIIDDPQDTEDARSEGVTDTDWEWFLSDIFFLGQTSRIFLIGNNLGERCIIERVLANPEILNFNGERIPVIDDAGNSAWPSKYRKEDIEAEKASFAELDKIDTWYREKMCRNIAPSSQIFKREYFRYYEIIDTRGMSVYTTMDPAISLNKNADYSVVLTIAVNEDGHWFVLDVDYGRYDPDQQINAIFNAVEKWRPMAVGIETIAYQQALKHFILKEMPRRNKFFTIAELQARTNKNLRIDTLQPRFVSNSVWFRREAKWLEKIEGELLAYPHGMHDDVIDALAYMEQIASAPISAGGGGLDASRLSEDLRRQRNNYMNNLYKRG